MKRKDINSKNIIKQEFSHLKSFHWKGKDAYNFSEDIVKFLFESRSIPFGYGKEADIIDFFKTSFSNKDDTTESVSENYNIAFDEFSEKQKYLISLIHITYMYAGYLTGSNFNGIEEKRSYVRLIHPDDDGETLKKEHLYPPRPKISSFFISEAHSVPSLKDLFNWLISIKNVFGSLLKHYYIFLEQFSLIDFSTYNKLSSAVSEEDFEVFTNIVSDWNWNDKDIKKLAAFIEETYPMTRFIEENENNWYLLDHELNSSHFGFKCEEFNYSFTGFLFMSLIIYLHDEFIKYNYVDEMDQFWAIYYIRRHAEDICEWIGHTTTGLNRYLKDSFFQNKNYSEKKYNSNEDRNESGTTDNKETTNRTGIDSREGKKGESTESTPCYLDLSNRKSIDFNKLVKLLTEPDELNNSNVFVSLAEGNGLNAVECLSYFFNHTADYLSFKLNWNGRNKVSLKLLIRLVKHFSRPQSILEKEEKQEGYVELTPENVVELKTKTGDGISEIVCKEKSKAEFWPRVARVFKDANSVNVATARTTNPETTEANLEEMRTIARIFFACLKKE